MKRLLLALLSAIALPTDFNANYFPELKVQPKNFREWFFIGGSHNLGAALCGFWVASEDMTLERAIFHRDNYILDTNQFNNKRFTELVIAGFNAGIDDIQKVHARDPKLKNINRKCDTLKIK